MKAWLLALALAIPVAAQELDGGMDVPALPKPAALALKAGELAPYDGTLLVAPNDLAEARRVVGCEASLADCKSKVEGHGWVPIVIAVAVTALLCGAGGVAIGATMARKP